MLNEMLAVDWRRNLKKGGVMRGKFWYSQRQKEIAGCQNFCQLDNGDIVEYTEMVTQGKNRSSIFTDATFLGAGVYHSSNNISSRIMVGMEPSLCQKYMGILCQDRLEIS